MCVAHTHSNRCCTSWSMKQRLIIWRWWGWSQVGFNFCQIWGIHGEHYSQHKKGSAFMRTSLLHLWKSTSCCSYTMLLHWNKMKRNSLKDLSSSRLTSTLRRISSNWPINFQLAFIIYWDDFLIDSGHNQPLVSKKRLIIRNRMYQSSDGSSSPRHIWRVDMTWYRVS